MNRYWSACIFLLFLATGACASPRTTASTAVTASTTFTPRVMLPAIGNGPVSTPTPVAERRPAIDDGLDFLKNQLNPDYGLLQESPNIGQHRYYLTNDNALAAYVLEQFGEAKWADSLTKTLDSFRYVENDFVEVVWGEAIPWPPRHHKDVAVAQLSGAGCDYLDREVPWPVGDCVFQETHTSDLGVFYDWSSYANLACMGAVNEFNLGRRETAQWLVQTEMALFDGYGFADAVYWEDRPETYETLGLAWCLYAGALLGEPVNEQLRDQLLAQQAPNSGGFHTHFQADHPRLADPNVETTSIALLALGMLDGDIPPREPSATPDSGDAPAPDSGPDLQSAIRDGDRFLHEQFNPALSLLRESPDSFPDRHWLATDNVLAVYALKAAGDSELASDVQAGLANFDETHHGLIEALVGEDIEWPPHVETQVEIAPGVWRESRLTGDQYMDWADYADLALYAALNAYNDGNNDLAHTRYVEALALAKLDGSDFIGFADKAFTDREGGPLYATYKLALALYVGAAIGEPLNPALLDALLAKQEAETGGFITLYDENGVPQGDASTETTSYALLALARLR